MQHMDAGAVLVLTAADPLAVDRDMPEATFQIDQNTEGRAQISRRNL